jgi:hypothetical protein
MIIKKLHPITHGHSASDFGTHRTHANTIAKANECFGLSEGRTHVESKSSGFEGRMIHRGTSIWHVSFAIPIRRARFRARGWRHIARYDFDKVSWLLFSRKEVTPAQQVQPDIHLRDQKKRFMRTTPFVLHQWPYGQSLLLALKEVTKKRCRNQKCTL